jgi:hypothetical protein
MYTRLTNMEGINAIYTNGMRRGPLNGRSCNIEFLAEDDDGNWHRMALNVYDLDRQ